jgi:hypothetical protein
MTTSAEQIRLRSPAAWAEMAKSETPAANPAAIQLLEFILSSSMIRRLLAVAFASVCKK